MAQLNIVSPDNYPIWFNGKVINEAVFCDEFLETHALVYTENSFFTPDGKLTDLNRLKTEVFGLIEPFICTNVDKTCIISTRTQVSNSTSSSAIAANALHWR